MDDKRFAAAWVWFKWWRFRIWHDGWYIQFELGPLIIAIDLRRVLDESAK